MNSSYNKCIKLALLFMIAISICFIYLYQSSVSERFFSLRHVGVDVDDIPKKFESNGNRTKTKTVPICPDIPPGLLGNATRQQSFLDHPWSEIRNQNSDLTPEGRYIPKECKSRHRVAIIIPLRGRESHLRILMSHMHPIWKRQQIEYQVYTITQSGNDLFNRAKLLNIGVIEANRDRPYDCYVLHDVDLLLEDDRCLYWCHEENPRHLAMYMNKFSYKVLAYGLMCYPRGYSSEKRTYTSQYFGGVSMLSAKQFSDINGFSNIYWGWGGEDDDSLLRLKAKGYSISNPYGRKCSYHMIRHERDSMNNVNNARNILLAGAIERMNDDGYLNSSYHLVSKEYMGLYTNITVDVGRPSKKMNDFMSQSFNGKYPELCFLEVPWRHGATKVTEKPREVNKHSSFDKQNSSDIP